MHEAGSKKTRAGAMDSLFVVDLVGEGVYFQVLQAWILRKDPSRMRKSKSGGGQRLQVQPGF